MKYLLLVSGIFISTLVSAQFSAYVNGGANYAQLHVTSGAGNQNGKGGFGWQAGGGIEYHTQFGYFLYLGLNVNYETFGRDSTSAGFPSIVSNYTYKPYFADIPIGIGYQFNFAKALGLKVYGGITPQVGLAGKLERRTTYYVADSSGKPVSARTDNNTHNLNFGRANSRQVNFDLANTNWGLTVGAGINVFHRAEIALSYQRDFTNVLPGKDRSSDINKIGFFELNLRLHFPNDYFPPEKR